MCQHPECTFQTKLGTSCHTSVLRGGSPACHAASVLRIGGSRPACACAGSGRQQSRVSAIEPSPLLVTVSCAVLACSEQPKHTALQKNSLRMTCSEVTPTALAYSFESSNKSSNSRAAAATTTELGSSGFWTNSTSCSTIPGNNCNSAGEMSTLTLNPVKQQTSTELLISEG